MNAKNNINIYIDREEKLKNQLNVFFREFGINDIYSKMTSNDLIRLKNIVSCVNNIVTLKATESFVKKLEEDEVITNDIANQIRQKISKQSANANGYDVQYDGNLGGEKFIAEVKCNIRGNKNTFGGEQKIGINNDIKKLLNVERKKVAKLTIEEAKYYYKFFVMLDNKMSRNYVEKLKGNMPIIEYTDKGCLNANAKDCVYVVYVTI